MKLPRVFSYETRRGRRSYFEMRSPRLLASITGFGAPFWICIRQWLRFHFYSLRAAWAEKSGDLETATREHARAVEEMECGGEALRIGELKIGFFCNVAESAVRKDLLANYRLLELAAGAAQVPTIETFKALRTRVAEY